MVKMANGDMRQALNILQSTFMSAGVISEDSVYACTGQPKPEHVKQIAESLLNSSFKDCMDTLHDMQQNKGFALVDILHELYK